MASTSNLALLQCQHLSKTKMKQIINGKIAKRLVTKVMLLFQSRQSPFSLVESWLLLSNRKKKGNILQEITIQSAIETYKSQIM